MMGHVPGEVGQFQIHDKIQGVAQEWEVEGGEICHQEGRGPGKGRPQRWQVACVDAEAA